MRLLLALSIVAFSCSSAQAQVHESGVCRIAGWVCNRHAMKFNAPSFDKGLGQGLAHMVGVTGNNSRPGRWCGWQMRQWFGGGPELNLAANWKNVGHPSSPHVGAIVVWTHHVGVISGQSGSQWIVKSGNDGGRVRERPRSIAGAVIREL